MLWFAKAIRQHMTSVEDASINKGDVMSEPVVSIVIPTYNMHEYIERSILSALAQSYSNIQVVVVDDGSADDTASIVESLANTQDRITLIRQPKKTGRLEACRAGIAAAQGALVMFLDASDEMLPDAVQTLLDAYDDKYDIVQCGFDIRYKYFVSNDERRLTEQFNTPPNRIAFDDDIVHLFFLEGKTTWNLCGKLMRTPIVKEAVESIPPSSITQAEDACLFFAVACISHSYKGLAGYRGYICNIDCGSSDARLKHMDLEQFSNVCNCIDSMNQIKAFLQESGRFDALHEDYERVRYEHVRTVADKMYRAVDRDLRPQALERMLQLWPAEETIAGLSDAAWFEEADCIEAFAASPALSCTPRQIRTVATYHYHMHIGGAEWVAASLARMWHEMGFRIVFFADEPQNQCAYDLPEDVIWIQLPDAETLDRGQYFHRAQAIADAVREYGIDAFVYQQWWNKFLVWDSMLLKTLNVPVCLMIHSVYKILFYYARMQEFNRSRVNRYLDGLVVLSEYDKAFWEHFNPRVWQTNNPAPFESDMGNCTSQGEDASGEDELTQSMAPHEKERGSSENLLWVGRLSYDDKQPQEALEIMARVICTHPQATLTIVGATEDRNVRRELKKLAGKLGLDKNVHFTGEHDDTTPYYKQADIHLLTSRLDGWCLVLSESKTFGLPCVMYEMPYLTLTKGNRGIIAVAQGDRDAAARAICELLEDADKRHSLGHEALLHARELSSFDFEGLWSDVFATLETGSPNRNDFEHADAEWNILLEGLQDSLDRASNPEFFSYARKKSATFARRIYRRFRGSM